jgi:Uma2 family endonuclease
MSAAPKLPDFSDLSQRLRSLPERPRGEILAGERVVRPRPDWTGEVLSPSTARYDRKLKARIYPQAAVDYRRLVDPELQTVETYQRSGDFWTLLETPRYANIPLFRRDSVQSHADEQASNVPDRSVPCITLQKEQRPAANAASLPFLD